MLRFILLLLICFNLEAKTVNLTISGLTKKLSANVEKNLSLYKASIEHQNLDEEQFELFIKRAAREIDESLEPFGYYSSAVKPIIKARKNSWKVKLIIDTGPCTTVKKIATTLNGPASSDPSLTNVFKDFKPALGSALEHGSYEESKANAISQLISQGYPLAHYTVHTIDVFPEEHKSEITLTLDSGPLFHVGDVSFSPPPFDESLLKRFIHFKKSDRYSANLVADLQHSLMASRYIQQVNISPKFDPEKTEVPLLVSIEAQKPNQYLTGIGYGTDTGLRVRAEWERRYFNRFGHGLNAKLGLSQRIQSTELLYILPGKDPSRDRYEAGFSYNDEHLDDRFSKVSEFSLGSISELKHWQRSISIRLHEEAYRESYFAPIIKQSVLLPRIVLTKTKRDQLFNPEEGYRLIISVQGVMDRLTDADNFIQTHLFFKNLIPLRENTSLMFRTELGATFPNNINQLPLSLRYFAGGDNSIRGFGYKQVKALFPTEVEGKQVQGEGGLFLSVASLELVQKIAGRFSASIFVDAGSAYNSFEDPFFVGAGLGLRYSSPVGPIRLELAKPLRTHFGLSNRLRWHISFGPEL